MKVIILAGGFGTRLSEYTSDLPKPMVEVGGKPILWHIMNTYSKFGHKDFYLALGYKAEKIKEYFLNYYSLQSNFKIDLGTGDISMYKKNSIDWKVTLVDTGLKSMTGGRIKRIYPFVEDDCFLVTYGDGLSDVDINKLIEFHKSHGKMVTVTAVRPSARFGQLGIENQLVNSFEEKPQTDQGWINGGYFVINASFIELIENDETILERAPLEIAAKNGELMAYKHEGFWQCMDTKRDRDYLESLIANDNAPWINLDK
jgi:glucose-1-phosphate cytidylyltransferase